MSFDAEWIWCEGEDSPRNMCLRARCRFIVADEGIEKANLLISADTRYELFFNGEWLGFGPVRAYPWMYSYDRYDVTAWLREGEENLVGVRVMHWGDHAFQYVRGRGGLCCELRIEFRSGRIEQIKSDEQWEVSPDPAYLRATVRNCPQLGYEEQFDARLAEDWLSANVRKGRLWEPARILGKEEVLPWKNLEERSIPFLTRDEVLPERVLAIELAKALPGQQWSFDMRQRLPVFREGLNTEALGQRGKALLTEIIAPRECVVRIYESQNYDPRQSACNGEKVRGRPGSLRLRQGRNLFVITGTCWPGVLFESEEELEFDASGFLPEGSEACPWVFCAPFDERDDTLERLYRATGPGEVPEGLPMHPVAESERLREDIFLLTSTQQFLLPENGFCAASIDGPQRRERLQERERPLYRDPEALLHHSAQATTLYPQEEGDLHLVLDFGRELVGFLVLELEASEGCIVDGNLFEGIDQSGIFWTNLLHNSFRYICRSGRQTFRSSVRRGFRYLSLTIRNAQGPVHIHTVYCLLSTYPVEKRGQFACSDALLTKIWEVAAYTVQLCMEDTYTDCPAYEQTFYVGDARNSALVNAMAFGAYALTERCLRLVAQSLAVEVEAFKKPHQRGREHLTTDHVVSGWFNVIPMWSFLWVWNIWEHYQLSGNRALLVELYPAVKEQIKRAVAYLTERNLFDLPDASNLVDWTPMDMPRDGEVTANSVLLVKTLRCAALMAEIVGEVAKAVEYREFAEKIYEAVNEYCWSEERGAYIDTVRDKVAYERYQARMRERGWLVETYEEFLEHERVSEPTNTLVLRCECAPTQRVERIMPLVLAAKSEDYAHMEPNWYPVWTRERIVPVGSPWFLFFTAETLIAQGQTEAAVEMIRKQWGYMLEKGATSFWEMFRYWTDEHWSRSLCHGWSAGPVYFLSTQVLGVQCVEVGYTRVRIAPEPCGCRWARGTVPTPRGEIFIHWFAVEDGWQIEIALPEGCVGEVSGPLLVGAPKLLTGVEGEIEQVEGGWRIRVPEGAHVQYFVQK